MTSPKRFRGYDLEMGYENCYPGEHKNGFANGCSSAGPQPTKKHGISI